MHVDGLRQCNIVRAYPGGIVRRGGIKYFVRDHQFETMEKDIIFREGKKIPVTIPTHKVTVNIGDVVHRHLQEGD